MEWTREKYHDFMDYLFKSQPALFMTFHEHIELENINEKGIGTVVFGKPADVKDEDYKLLMDLVKFWK